VRFRAFYHLPYVMLVERDARWEEADPAAAFARRLHGLRRAFFDLYGAALGVAPDRHRPVPVVVFASREAYHRYLAARGERDVLGTEAHFEPKDERLVLHAECRLATILHEGTHQLVRANIRAPLETYAQSFWFHEGVAEWFAGSRELGDGPDGVPRYEPGSLLRRDVEPGAFLGPLAILRGIPPAQRTPIDKLAGIMLKDRDTFSTQGEVGSRKIVRIYAEGWFLIYFLNHFEIDAAGVVQVGAPGRYRDLWIAYLKREMAGESGAKALLEVIREAGVPLDRLERERAAYLEFVLRKLARGEVADQKLVPSKAQGGDRLEG
jgi:hypothetical protein